MDTTNSKKITQRYVNRSWELYSFQTHFSGTWNAKMEDLTAMLCPAGEADWIPGWTAEILHSERSGYVSEKCIFKTDESNTAWPAGYWYFTDYKENELLEVVVFLSNWISHWKIVLQDHEDGSITGTWYFKVLATAKQGNKTVKKFQKKLNIERRAVPIVIGHYLSTGKKLSKPAVMVKLLTSLLSGKY
ncbi:MAG: hypothetical protein PVI26_14745 [Chitinispirillia bacterium]|jgi:hypothetical protein